MDTTTIDQTALNAVVKKAVEAAVFRFLNKSVKNRDKLTEEGRQDLLLSYIKRPGEFSHTLHQDIVKAGFMPHGKLLTLSGMKATEFNRLIGLLIDKGSIRVATRDQDYHHIASTTKAYKIISSPG